MPRGQSGNGKSVQPRSAEARAGQSAVTMRPLEPIQDPFLGDHLAEFRVELARLKETCGAADRGADYLAAATKTCELSRKILFRLMPGDEKPEFLLMIVTLFRDAVRHIEPDPAQRLLGQFRVNIEARAREILAELPP